VRIATQQRGEAGVSDLTHPRRKAEVTTRNTKSRIRVALGLMAAAACLFGCGVTGPVGPTPGSTVSAEPETATPTYDGLMIEIYINAQTVTPVDAEMEIARSRSVALQIQTDHDVTVRVKGPEIDESVFVDRLSTINSTFVVDQPGTVTITCDDPEATIATLTVT
jgi:hypothetical protein